MECYYGKGERRRLIGWLIDGRYLQHVKVLRGRRIRRHWPSGSYQIEKLDGSIVLKVAMGGKEE